MDEPLASGPKPDVHRAAAVALQGANGPGATDQNREPGGIHRVELHLIHTNPVAQCEFWIGLAAVGPHAPLKLLAEPELASVLRLAAGEGVSEAGPIMLSDTLAVPPRSLLLMPIPAADFRSRTLWVVDLARTLQAWTPQRIGFYLAPEALPAEAGLEILAAVLRELITNTPATCFYLLTGEHGLNPLLNAALRLKSELQSPTLSLFVYH